MTKNVRKVLLTPRIYHMYETRLGTKRNNLGFIVQEDRFKCRKCGKKFEIGDIIISKPKRNGKHVLYHLSCYDSMFYDVEDDDLMIQPHVLISNN